MAISEIYVDPSIAADSGTGTVGDPFGDVEYGIKQTTFGAEGTRVNVKAGTDEILAADLINAINDSVTTPAWVPAEHKPIIIQGYTTAAGDGGIGGIDGNAGNFSILNSGSMDWIHIINMHVHNSGTARLIDLDNYCSLVNCELGPSGGAGFLGNIAPLVHGNYCHGLTTAIQGASGGMYTHNYIDDCSLGITANSTGSHAWNNIIVCSGAQNGITLQERSSAVGNSIYSAGGTGYGISSTSLYVNGRIANNLVEGFSGAGGRGIVCYDSMNFDGNAVYNCTTEYAKSGEIRTGDTDNEILTASPFTSAATGDFNPVDTGNVKEGSLPAGFGTPAQ